MKRETAMTTNAEVSRYIMRGKPTNNNRAEIYYAVKVKGELIASLGSGETALRLARHLFYVEKRNPRIEIGFESE